MKKLLFATLCFASFTATGLYAQKGNTTGNSGVSSQGSHSNARQGKNVGKGSPLLQRQGGSTSEDKAADAPAETGRSTSEPAKATNATPLRDSLGPATKNQPQKAPAATSTGTKPKE